MVQHLFFDQAIRLVKLVWLLIAISGGLLLFSFYSKPLMWYGIVLGGLIGCLTLVVFAKKSVLIRLDSYAIMPRPFKTSSILCFMASAIAWIWVGDFANPFTISLGITGLFYLVAKIIEPEYYWLSLLLN